MCANSPEMSRVEPMQQENQLLVPKFFGVTYMDSSLENPKSEIQKSEHWTSRKLALKCKKIDRRRRSLNGNCDISIILMFQNTKFLVCAPQGRNFWNMVGMWYLFNDRF